MIPWVRKHDTWFAIKSRILAPPGKLSSLYQLHYTCNKAGNVTLYDGYKGVFNIQYNEIISMTIALHMICIWYLCYSVHKITVLLIESGVHHQPCWWLVYGYELYTTLMDGPNGVFLWTKFEVKPLFNNRFGLESLVFILLDAPWTSQKNHDDPDGPLWQLDSLTLTDWPARISILCPLCNMMRDLGRQLVWPLRACERCAAIDLLGWTSVDGCPDMWGTARGGPLWSFRVDA